ncbi:hypothetical protein GGP41_004532 [Bipolaris sorokiniana]|uniref:Uncharacterized protein n=1 Tax=Cochliobolus sativus TaxID=45130 RepID=A0A8H6DQT2_COCSA|nr:hypothetical protein GGP41_004532 [Bipolaris sorokiniana]
MTTTTPHYGKYLLVLSGSVEYAPFLENWKTLKDSVRKNAGNPGWTDEYDGHVRITIRKSKNKYSHKAP